MITIGNDGPRIASTNYFDSEHAQKGFYFLSWNASTARILVPDSRRPDIAQMRSAKEIIISRGPWIEQGGRDAIELLFEDHTDSPFMLLLTMEQCDRTLPDTDQGRGKPATIWTREGLQLTLPAAYRRVNGLPYLQAWGD